MIRALVVALHPALRVGLRALLEGDGIAVQGEAATLHDLGVALHTLDLLVLADSTLPEEVAPLLPQSGELALLLVGQEGTALAGWQALPLQGWGLVPPDATADELHIAALAVTHGFFLAPAGQGHALLRPSPPPPDGPVEPLTARELEVLAFLGDGLANKQIARALAISEHTVKFHLSSIFSKLGASSRTDAVTRGARHGLLSL